MSLKRLMLAIGVVGLLVLGVAACGGGTETVTVDQRERGRPRPEAGGDTRRRLRAKP